MATISLDADIEILLSTMRNPLKANICASKLSIAVGNIHKALDSCTSIATKVKIAKSHPEFLRAGIRFLTFKQSVPDQRKMMDHLSTCHCNPDKRCLYNPARYKTRQQNPIFAYEYLFDMVYIVATCLLLVINDLTQHKFRSGTVITGEKRWPQGPDDLLPYGPKDSVLGLELWVSIPPLGYILFRLAGRLALCHVPFAREVFRPPKYTFTLVLPFQHLLAALLFHDLPGNLSSNQRTHYFTHPVMMIFDFFDHISQFDVSRYDLMITGKSWLLPILARLSTILAPLPADEWLHTRMKVLYLTAFASAKFDPVTRTAEVKFDREKILKELRQGDELEPVFIMMVEARRLGCSNISCSSESEIIHSRLCAKCNLIRFCGKEVSLFFPLSFTQLGWTNQSVPKGGMEPCFSSSQISLRKNLLCERSDRSG